MALTDIHTSLPMIMALAEATKGAAECHVQWEPEGLWTAVWI
jgi:hypothetical protein